MHIVAIALNLIDWRWRWERRSADDATMGDYFNIVRVHPHTRARRGFDEHALDHLFAVDPARLRAADDPGELRALRSRFVAFFHDYTPIVF